MKQSYLPLPLGFMASGVHAGLKRSGKLDMALICSSLPATAAGMVTVNRVKAAPTRHTERALKSGAKIQAIVVNTKYANALTGRQGQKDVFATTKAAAGLLGIPIASVLAHSTGVIGVPLPMEKIQRGLRECVLRLSRKGGMDAAQGILTVDKFAKTAAKPLWVSGKHAWLTGMAKGAGMIQPNMATMLVYLLTDLNIPKKTLQKALREAVEPSFHRITVEGDTSTNDSVVLLANGACGNKPVGTSGADYRTFSKALSEICLELAQQMVWDGEGATKFVTIEVKGAKSDGEAVKAAKAVANSSLVKTALYGADPNWGRILAAVGNAEVAVDEFKAKVFTGGYRLYNAGKKVQWSRNKLKEIFSKRRIDLLVDLGLGRGSSKVYTCDLTEEFVRLNSRYTT